MEPSSRCVGSGAASRPGGPRRVMSPHLSSDKSASGYTFRGGGPTVTGWLKLFIRAARITAATGPAVTDLPEPGFRYVHPRGLPSESPTPMMKSLPIVFALLTGLFWGTYGPALAQARAADPLKNPFKPYLMIGLAYLVWGVVGGAVGMKLTGTSFQFTSQQALWGFVGGTLGAFGAWTLTLAMFTGGGAMPQVVMPIVFGTAVSVSAIVATLTVKNAVVHPMLYVGIVGMAACIIIVAAYTPHAHPPKAPKVTADPAPATH